MWKAALLWALSTVCLAAGRPFVLGDRIAADDFTHGAGNWAAELEKGGSISAKDGTLDIDVPGGLSLWWKQEFAGPILIRYEATMVKAGGANDRVSDLNCFWMAADARSPDFFAAQRSGKFADYNQLRAYYVGQGGNGNTTTRFRRYIGDAELRPLLPEHDLKEADTLLKPDAPQTIELVAAGGRIQYYRDGNLLFDYRDPGPYTHGYFAFRTVESHIRIRNFAVYRIAVPQRAGVLRPRQTYQAVIECGAERRRMTKDGIGVESGVAAPQHVVHRRAGEIEQTW